MHQQSMQFVCWGFVARCLTKFHLFTDVLLELKTWHTSQISKHSLHIIVLKEVFELSYSY